MPLPVEEKCVAEAEIKLGTKFPETYRNRMREANGGELEAAGDTWHLYPIFDASDKKRVKRTANDVVHETLSAHKWRGFPPDAVAVAGNDAGDQLLFLPNQLGEAVLGPKVFAWNHETSELTVLAANFAQLDGWGT